MAHPARGTWVVPRKVDLDSVQELGLCLRWKRGDGYEIQDLRPGLLEDFFSVSRCRPMSIRNYARRWGVLEICKHGLPASHNPFRPDRDDYCSPMSGAGGCLPSPVSTWRLLSARFRALVRIDAKLRAGELGMPEDWRLLSPHIKDNKRSG